MRDRRLTLVALSGLAALVLAACGSGGSSKGSGGANGASSNGIASKTANQIVAAATTAVDGVSAVRVNGDLQSGADKVALDLHIVAGKGATGSMSENGLSFKFITLGDEGYLYGSPGFLKKFAGAQAAQLIDGHWLKAPTTSSDFASFSELTDLHQLVAQLLGAHGGLTKGTTTAIGGVPVIAIHDAAKGGTLYVATTGKPYPIEITSGSAHGTISFSNFNEPVAIAAPAKAIDLTKLHG